MGGIWMEVTYRRNIGKSFMVISGICMQLDYQIEMCRRNRIHPFLEFETIVADGRMEYWYDITGRQSLEEFIKHRKLGYQELRKLTAAIRAGIEAAENYLLKEQSVLLSPEYLYVSNYSGEVLLCYCPGEEAPLEEKFHALMEILLAYIDHGDEQAVAVSYRMYQMTVEPNYGIEEIWNLLGAERNFIPENEEEKQSGERKERTGGCYEEEEKGTDCVEEELVYPVQKKRGFRKMGKERGEALLEKWLEKSGRLIQAEKQKFTERMRGSRASVNQMVFEPIEENRPETVRHTTFLGQNKEKRKMAKLVYMGEEVKREIYLDKEIYCIGSQNDTDITIGKETVSRLHARINKSDGVYYIEDLNSRNGTWVNGKLLHYMEKISLRDGDVIAFADERFRYEEEE